MFQTGAEMTRNKKIRLKQTCTNLSVPAVFLRREITSPAVPLKLKTVRLPLFFSDSHKSCAVTSVKRVRLTVIRTLWDAVSTHRLRSHRSPQNPTHGLHPPPSLCRNPFCVNTFQPFSLRILFVIAFELRIIIQYFVRNVKR